MERKREMSWLMVVAMASTGVAVGGWAGENVPRFSFGLVADVQYADAPSRGNRHYQRSLEKLREAVGVFNSEEVDRVMDVGDLVDRGPESFDAVLDVYGNLNMPLSIALGNHDFPKSRGHTLNVLRMEESYYTIDQSGVRFIVLDGNDISTLARPAGHEKHQQALALLKQLKEEGAANAQSWNGAIGQEQLDWFARKLREAEDQGLPVLVFCHFPLYPQGAHTLWNRNEVIDVIQSSPNVVAWFNGHHHAGAYVKRGGVHYLTLPGMVETAGNNAFAIVDVYDQHLKIHGYGRTQSRIFRMDPLPSAVREAD